MGSDELLTYAMRTNRHRHSCFGRWNRYHTLFCAFCEHHQACHANGNRRAAKW
jgi:hypothetical protein